MKKFVMFFIIAIFFNISATRVNAIVCQQPNPAVTGLPTSAPGVRCSTCDACGYCPNLPTPVPQSWEQCRNCLYPGLTSFPADQNETLRIDPTTGAAPTTMVGSSYTMFGCINTGGFRNEYGTGAAGVTQFLLNIVFSTVGGVAFLYLIYGAFIILTSQSNPERLIYGKNIIWGSLIGLIFSLMSVFIINIIASGVLKIPGFNSLSTTPTP